MTYSLRILLLDQSDLRSSALQEELEGSGYEVVRHIGETQQLERSVMDCEPDVIIIEQDSPDRDVLESLQIISERNPRPIVMFSDDDDAQTIRTAIRSGVAAYVSRDVRLERIRPVLDVAIARFQRHQELCEELAQAKSSLEERKWIERAKGLLMDRLDIPEGQAYETLRKIAMDRNVRLIDLAHQVVENAGKI